MPGADQLAAMTVALHRRRGVGGRRFQRAPHDAAGTSLKSVSTKCRYVTIP